MRARHDRRHVPRTVEESGVVQVNFYPVFLSEIRKASKERDERLKPALAS